MMVLHRDTGEIEHRRFTHLTDYFGKDDLFVINNTKVFPARMYGKKEKTGARIEVFLLRELNPALKLWDVLVDPARKIRIGNKLYFGEDESLVAEVIDNTTSRGRTLRFLTDMDHAEFKKILYQMGQPPLPTYITRELTSDDTERYQSIFAQKEGAVVAPAAALHFSPQLHLKLQLQDCRFAFVTLHNSLGMYRKIEVEDLNKYKIDSEEMFVTYENCKEINAVRDLGKRICAVGTSVLRAMETAVSSDGYIKEYEGWTNRFIFPPYRFSLPNAMITNFHAPLSILLIMTAAFAGHDELMNAYDVAIKEGYKFGAYGDALLVI